MATKIPTKINTAQHATAIGNGEAMVTVAVAREATAEALGRARALCDHRGETSSHCDRVAAIAMDLACRCSPELAADPELVYGFRLHDIGMIAVSGSVLLKTDDLTRDELDEIQEHPWLGERIIARVPYLSGVARQIIGGHHERWDGSGYPRGLAGHDIPLAARIFAVVDAYESMTTPKPYRRALSRQIALAEIARQSRHHFDPDIVPVFLAMAEGLVVETEEPDPVLAAQPHSAPGDTEA